MLKTCYLYKVLLNSNVAVIESTLIYVLKTNRQTTINRTQHNIYVQLKTGYHEPNKHLWDLRWSGMVKRSCSTYGTCRVARVSINLVMSLIQLYSLAETRDIFSLIVIVSIVNISSSGNSNRVSSLIKTDLSCKNLLEFTESVSKS